MAENTQHNNSLDEIIKERYAEVDEIRGLGIMPYPNRCEKTISCLGAKNSEENAEVATAAMAAPQDFNTISPFGAPPRERKGVWYFLLIAVGILALLALGVFGVMLAGAA